MENLQEMLEAISERREVPCKIMSVKKLLDKCNMGAYANMACDRIVYADLVDDESVCIDWCDLGDICLNSSGILACREILESYIPEDSITAMYRYLKSESRIVYLMNKQINFLRQCKRVDLKNILSCDASGYQGDPETVEHVYTVVKAELKARSLKNMVRAYTKKCVKKLIVFLRVARFRYILWRYVEMEI